MGKSSERRVTKQESCAFREENKKGARLHESLSAQSAGDYHTKREIVDAALTSETDKGTTTGRRREKQEGKEGNGPTDLRRNGCLWQCQKPYYVLTFSIALMASILASMH